LVAQAAVQALPLSPPSTFRRPLSSSGEERVSRDRESFFWVFFMLCSFQVVQALLDQPTGPQVVQVKQVACPLKHAPLAVQSNWVTVTGPAPLAASRTAVSSRLRSVSRLRESFLADFFVVYLSLGPHSGAL
jgi:hypothetical protein